MGSERWFTTKGAVTGNTQRPEQILRNTKRKVSRSITGIAGPNNKSREPTRPKIKKSTKRNFKGSGPRNAGASGAWTNVDQGDYGASGYEIYDNERATTGLRTHITNIATTVKEITMPLMDVFRRTRKENYQGPNQTGVVTTGVSKSVAYDPNDVARTTIKETMIDNKSTGQLSGPKKLMTYDPNDIARTTIREQTEDNNYLGHANPSNVDKNSGYIIANETTNMVNTNRQFTADHEYIGQADGNFAGGDGYKTANYTARNTNKQFTSDHEYSGTASSIHSKEMSYDNMYNARINHAKEELWLVVNLLIQMYPNLLF